MITEGYYPCDTRVRQEAELLVKNGHKISVIAIKAPHQKYFENVNGVKVRRVPEVNFLHEEKTSSRLKSEKIRKYLNRIKEVIGYSLEYAYFTTIAFLLSFIALFKDKFNVIHLHNPPDTLVLIAMVHKILFNKKIVFDHHDLSPDLFYEKYNDGNKIIYSILLAFEKLSCKFADIVIATNESYKMVEIERCGIDSRKIFIVRNGPDLNFLKISRPIESLKELDKTILGYLGVVNIQDGVDNLIKIIHKIVYEKKYNKILLLIIGGGDYIKRIKELANELDVTEYIIFTGFIRDYDLLSRYLSTVDIFIDAAQTSFLNERSTFIKHMEYMVFEKPVISYNLKESMYSLKDAGIFVPSGDMDRMAKTVLSLIDDTELRKSLGVARRGTSKTAILAKCIEATTPGISRATEILTWKK